MPKEVLFIADDFGLNSEVNAAIISAHLKGALHGAALMMGQPGTQEAIRLAMENPTLRVGWHLHLCDSSPLTRKAWPWGKSRFLAGFLLSLPGFASITRAEFDAQWSLYQKSELPCHFVNGQMIQRTFSCGFKGFVRLGMLKFFNCSIIKDLIGLGTEWFSVSRKKRAPYRLSTTLWGVDRIFCMNSKEVAAIANGLGNGLHEFIFHPRRPEMTDQDYRCLINLKREAEQVIDEK